MVFYRLTTSSRGWSSWRFSSCIILPWCTTMLWDWWKSESLVLVKDWIAWLYDKMCKMVIIWNQRLPEEKKFTKELICFKSHVSFKFFSTADYSIIDLIRLTYFKFIGHLSLFQIFLGTLQHLMDFRVHRWFLWHLLWCFHPWFSWKCFWTLRGFHE